MTHDDDKSIQDRDLVIIDKGILGKYAYQVKEDIFDYVRLIRVDLKEDEYQFNSYEELEKFIETEPNVSWISLHK